ncbi:MAG TPA: FAD-dependent oxidoreductase, partial [Gemmatimonadaceae bacterium]|nr:FAD-dependent oxidoreductase [Gemmatimonadaceae bacterium]
LSAELFSFVSEGGHLVRRSGLYFWRESILAILFCSVALPQAVKGQTAAPDQQATNQTFDVVVYGGTAGGVIAAVAAARMGLSVALLEPSQHLGGMVTGGLSATDHGNKIVVGGYALEVYERIGRKYGVPLWWYPEPKVAEQVLNEMVGASTELYVFLGHRLKAQGGVHKTGTTIEEIVTENGDRFRAKLFLDSSYEGDLMAQAGVSYTVGRESSAQYGESLAGVRPKDRAHQFDVKVEARDARGRLIPEISAAPRGEIGSGDKRVQAYNFRMILTTDPRNQVRFLKPRAYDPQRYELLRRLIEATSRARGSPPPLGELLLIRADLPHSKADFNNRGAFSTDYIGKSYDYPEGSYDQRARIWTDHVDYVKGLLYYLANDRGVPRSIRDEMNRWGLAKDEFADNDNWPYQLYVREGRRMLGEFVMTQRDIQVDTTKPDAIAMGSYNSDSHNVQRFVQSDGTVQNEGNMEVAVEPYQIPFRMILPKRTQATNLLVPVCFSASHVTYSTLRMEPQYMMIGQAAGVASALALKAGVPIHDVDVAQLRRTLKAQGMVDVYNPAKAPRIPPPLRR